MPLYAIYHVAPLSKDPDAYDNRLYAIDKYYGTPSDWKNQEGPSLNVWNENRADAGSCGVPQTGRAEILQCSMFEGEKPKALSMVAEVVGAKDCKVYVSIVHKF